MPKWAFSEEALGWNSCKVVRLQSGKVERLTSVRLSGVEVFVIHHSAFVIRYFLIGKLASRLRSVSD